MDFKTRNLDFPVMVQSLRFADYVRSILGILAFTVILLIAIPFIFVICLLFQRRGSDFVMKFVAPMIGRPVLAVSGINFSIKHHGEHLKEPAIYLINHSSTLDIPSILAVGVPKMRVIAKWELQYLPLIFIAGRLTGQVFIKRGNSEKAIKTLQKTYARLLKHGTSVMVAPEGSRKHEGVIGPFKKGAFRMAIDIGYPIIPIYFDGSSELSSGSSIFTKKGNVTAHIQPKVDTSSWKIETIDEHVEEVRNLYLGWAGVTEN